MADNLETNLVTIKTENNHIDLKSPFSVNKRFSFDDTENRIAFTCFRCTRHFTSEPTFSKHKCMKDKSTDKIRQCSVKECCSNLLFTRDSDLALHMKIAHQVYEPPVNADSNE